MSELLRLVRYRRADHVRDQEEIFRLRHRSYLREKAIAARPDGRLVDTYDSLPNSWSFGVYVEDILASTIRLTVNTPSCSILPAQLVFPDVVEPMLETGKVIMDPTRFVVDETMAHRYPKLPHVTLRLAFLASQYFKVDVTFATVRTEHQAFYKRMLGYRLVCPARPYPSLLKPISLMSLELPAIEERCLRYPFLASTEAERDALFGPTPSP